MSSLLSSSSLLTPAISSSVVATTTSRDVGRWGVRAGAQSQQDWARGRVNIERQHKKGKKSWHHASCDTQFLREINPREKSGNAVACASVAPMQLHCLICHKGIKTWQIIAARRRNGGGGLITLLAFGCSSPVWGLFLEAREDIPKKYF